MVNYGVSRGCRTCKKRRKKCDEARPSCTRCMKAKLACLGYTDETDLIFRCYGVQENAILISQDLERWQNLCSVMVSWPYATDDFWINQLALSEFFNDYRLVPKENYLSRGYLAGLETLLADTGPSSDVAAAARTVALASLANKHRDPLLSQSAGKEYSKLLRAFSITMSKPESSGTVESLTTAVLLGIYEIISARKGHPGEHEAHFRGVAAILSSNNSVFSQHPVKQLWPEGDMGSHRYDEDSLIWPQDLSMIYPRDPGPSVPGLDTLLQCYSPFFRKCKALTSDFDISIDELQKLREYAIAVDQEFAIWPANLPKSWQPRSLGLVNPAFKNGLLPGLSSAPGRIDVYLDLYVSSMWNSFRKCRLVLLALIYKCSTRLQLQGFDLEEIPTPTTYKIRSIPDLAEQISEDLAASIPFNLFRNPEVFVVAQHQQQSNNGKKEAIVPNVSLGGLLLMHVILVVSTIPIVPPRVSQSFREYLVWIGRVMGIGQSEVVSDPSCSFPREFILDGHILVWTGMMIP